MLQRGAAQAWLLHIPWLKKNGTTVPDKVKAHSFHFIIALEFWAGASLTMSIQISFHFLLLDLPRKLEYFDVPPSTAALKHARNPEDTAVGGNISGTVYEIPVNLSRTVWL